MTDEVLRVPAENEVDARGLRCPLPVIRLAAACRDRAPGTLMVVLTTDPAARIDVPAWARMRGHEIVAQRDIPEDAFGSADPVGSTHLSTTVRLG